MILEFKIDGMTCVSCSQTIEGSMESEFNPKGLKEVQVALLTHKMRLVFDLQLFRYHALSPELIASEVEMIGFTAELIEMIENDQEEMLRQMES
jgi:cation transport ATPase